MYQHYKSFNLSFGSYLKTLITIPSNFKTIIHAPYLFVLHPFTAIMPILLAFAFAPFSTATAQKLNHELFGEMVAEYLLKVPTIIAITLFNVMGIPSVFFDFYRYLTRVGFTLSDKINACRDINPVNEDDEVDYSGVMGKVRYLTDYRKTRDLYHFLAFCDTFNSGLERMDVTYLYLNLLQAVLPTEIQPLSDADRSWQEYQLRTKALETFMNFTQESASKMVKNIAQPPREAVLTTQQFNSIMPLYFGNAQPNTIIPTVDPSIQRYDDVKNFQALLGRPYNGIISSLSTPAESRTRVKNDRFFADGASGEFACVHDVDARMILAQHGNIQEGNRQSNSL